jgi:hypothetical protein
MKSLLVALAVMVGAPAQEGPVSVATFEVDATPPVGTPLTYTPANWIVDPLSARGIVILGQGDPIVLCAVDAITIEDEGHDAWRKALAEAAGTPVGRVAVHVLHQHDAPSYALSAERMEAGQGDGKVDPGFARRLIGTVAEAVREAVKNPARATHVGLGRGRVEKVASNRRILGPDGRVKVVRWSSSRDPEAIAAPEGVIDPDVRLISFWDGDRPVVSLSYYATHPQSYYRKGGVSADFVGMARSMREGDEPGTKHIHFCGAGGNVAAGKYNDGSFKMRPILAMRLARGMEAAWEAARANRSPIRAKDVGWSVSPVTLPVADHVPKDDPFRKRMESGRKIDVACLRLGAARVLHLPGELFVEYQLAAQKMQPDAFVCMAAYGDGGPSYIGTEVAYGQGGYETSPRSSKVAPSVERVLMAAMRDVLGREAGARLDRENLLVYRDGEGRVRPVKEVADWLARREAVLAGMQHVMGPLPGREKRCPLDVRTEEEADCGSYVRRLIRYASEPGSLVPAYLLIPKDALAGERKAPAALCLHPTNAQIGHKGVVGLGGRANRQYAHELAERGYVTLAPSYPLLANYQPDLEKLGHRSGTMKAIWDNIRGIDLLLSLPQVKEGGVGAIGHSLGGHNAVFTAVFDERIKAVVSSCGLDSFLDYRVGQGLDAASERTWGQTRYMPGISEYRGRLEAIPFDFHELVGALAPRHCLIAAPLGDANFKWESVDRIAKAAAQVYRLYGVPDRLRVEHPECAHDFPDEMREAAYRLFDSVLSGKAR